MIFTLRTSTIKHFYAPVDLVPEDLQLVIFDLEGPFNQDTEQNTLDKVKEFKTKIREADGISIFSSQSNNRFCVYAYAELVSYDICSNMSLQLDK